MWTRSTVDRGDNDSPYYSILKLDGNGMTALRQMFPDGEANEMNAVLFSTSGVHGTYFTIEDIEKGKAFGTNDGPRDLTFLVIQPRIVCMRYGECRPETTDDIAWLKNLRASSLAALAKIGLDQ